MIDAATFKDWLLKPGNHRLFSKLREQLGVILQHKVDIRTWPDLYQAFEKSMGISENYHSFFEPVFSQFPPTEERGATEKQIRLYRGALVPDSPEQPPSSLSGQQKQETVKMTYRGQVIEKPRDSNKSEDNKEGKKPRYYRGARIN